MYKSIRIRTGMFVLVKHPRGHIYKPLGGLWLSDLIGIVRRRRCFRCRFNPKRCRQMT